MKTAGSELEALLTLDPPLVMRRGSILEGGTAMSKIPPPQGFHCEYDNIASRVVQERPPPVWSIPVVLYPFPIDDLDK